MMEEWVNLGKRVRSCASGHLSCRSQTERQCHSSHYSSHVCPIPIQARGEKIV
jgi:hypothetical protein